LKPKHPEVTVQLTGLDGNAFAILGRCQHAARRGGLSSVEIARFFDEAMGGDYDHLLRTCLRWFECD
jgi:hypothetical protein